VYYLYEVHLANVHRLVAPAVMAWSGAMKRVAGFLEELIESRVQEAAHFSKKSNIYVCESS